MNDREKLAEVRSSVGFTGLRILADVVEGLLPPLNPPAPSAEPPDVFHWSDSYNSASRNLCGHRCGYQGEPREGHWNTTDRERLSCPTCVALLAARERVAETPVWHYMPLAGECGCGADYPGIQKTTVTKNVTCPECLRIAGRAAEPAPVEDDFGDLAEVIVQVCPRGHDWKKVRDTIRECLQTAAKREGERATARERERCLYYIHNYWEGNERPMMGSPREAVQWLTNQVSSGASPQNTEAKP